MAWVLLPVDYTDAVWSGLKRYIQTDNGDGTISLQDVTVYSQKEKSFFGARDANRMNEALNTIMSMVENGTDLYEAFQNYFADQKVLFEQEADQKQADFTAYMDGIEKQGDALIEELETGYRTEITQFEEAQEQVFNTWFEFIKGQLTDDVAGNLQNQIDTLEVKTDGFAPMTTTFSADGKHIVEVSGSKRIETDFQSDTVIVQRLYENDVLMKTKTITFSADGMTIEEGVK